MGFDVDVVDPLVAALTGGTTTIQVTTDAADDLNQGIYYASLPDALDFSASTDVTATTPEPASLALTGLGVCVIGLWVRRRRTV